MYIILEQKNYERSVHSEYEKYEEAKNRLDILNTYKMDLEGSEFILYETPDPTKYEFLKYLKKGDYKNEQIIINDYYILSVQCGDHISSLPMGVGDLDKPEYYYGFEIRIGNVNEDLYSDLVHPKELDTYYNEYGSDIILEYVPIDIVEEIYQLLKSDKNKKFKSRILDY